MAEDIEDKKRGPSVIVIVAAVVALVAIVALGRFCSSAATIDVTVNGNPLTLHGAKTMETAIRESGLPINPGDFISLTGSVLKKSAGHPFAATVNDQDTTDPNFQLRSGDVVTVRDGDDIVEDYDAQDAPMPHGGEVTGLGAVCAITPGIDGVYEVRTGKVSGDVVKKVKTPATSTTGERYNPKVGDDKVVALTFDEGPTEAFTASILDILRDNDAKATFFCTGSKVQNNTGLVQRERDEGHQVCSSTFSLTWTSILTGKRSDDRLDAAQVADEVSRGKQALADALGEEANRCVRIAVPDLSGDMVAAIESQVDADISWSIDTGDWMEYNTSQIYNVLVEAEPGDVISLHDGGGDRSATIQALSQALPEMKDKGFSFITIDELRRYPKE